MKLHKIGLYLFSIIFLGSFWACDNDLVITADKKDIPIVYAFISPSDSLHYIRVERAFLDPETSAIELAKSADSIYYKDGEIVVQIRDTETDEVYTFNRINGDDEGIPRDSGDLANVPNILYKLILPDGESIRGGRAYELILDRGENLAPVTATATMVSNFNITRPIKGDDDPVSIYYNTIFFVKWLSESDAPIFDVYLDFFYEEENPATNMFELKSISWPVVQNFQREGNTSTVTFIGEDFYRTIDVLLENQPVERRKFKNMTFRVAGAGPELQEYIRIVQANTGITSAEVNPTYSNLSEGLGIFSSRNFDEVSGVRLDFRSLDSLRNGKHTGDLGFEL